MSNVKKYLVDVFYGATKADALDRLGHSIGHFFPLSGKESKGKVGESIPDLLPAHIYAWKAQKVRRKTDFFHRPLRPSFWIVTLYKLPKADVKYLQQLDRTFIVDFK